MSIENNGSPNMDECIICFEKHTDKNPLHDFNNINTIIVSCKCSYKCHIDCLHSWLNQNSMCLICNNTVVAIPSILNLDVSTNVRSLSAPLLTYNNEKRIAAQYSPPPPYSSVAPYYDNSNTENTMIANERILSLGRTGENIVISVNNNIHSRIPETSESEADTESSNSSSTYEEVEIVDSDSCRCCCIVLTLITIGIVIKSVI